MHATALAFDKAGNLLVGTESPGRVLRIDPDGKAFVLLDSPFQEIRSLRFDDKGVLYAAAVSGRDGGGGAARAQDRRPQQRLARKRAARADRDRHGRSHLDLHRRCVQRRRHLRVGPRGSPRAKRSHLPHHAGRPVGSTLGVARRLTVRSRLRRPRAAHRRHRQQRQDLPAGRRPAAAHAARRRRRATGDGAVQGSQRAVCISRPPIPESSSASIPIAQRGGRTSPSRATHGPSLPGETLSWRGTVPAGGRVEVFTRSGNTDTPDDTWSPWSTAYTVAEGSAVTSPKARFLQWRVVMTGKNESPVLTSVTAAYLQRNLRPQVRSLTVHPPGIVFQKPFSNGEPDLAGFENQTTPDRALTNAAMNAQQSGSGSPPLGRRTYQKGLQTIIWRAEDENEDDLAYEIRYRREGEATWKVLRHDLTDSILVWDTTTVPNGTYFAKVVASDSPSNAAGTALAGELDSVAFEIDNTRAVDCRPEHAVRGRPLARLVRRQGRPLAGSTRRMLAGWPAVAPDLPRRRHRRLQDRTLRADPRRPARSARPQHPRHRRDEQRRHHADRSASTTLTKRSPPRSQCAQKHFGGWTDHHPRARHPDSSRVPPYA